MPFVSGIGPGELIILFVPFVVLVVLVVALRAARGRDLPSMPDPRVVLAGRLARGEITRDEFDTAMRALGFPVTPPPPPGD
jgi:uncharacterized membrane protein